MTGDPMNDLGDVLAYLSSTTNYEVERGYRYGERTFDLGRMAALVDRTGHPERAYPCVHVAGTKGKGSVVAMVDSIARAAGLRTGLYTSPHLFDLRERIAVAGEPVAGADLAHAFRAVVPASEELRAAGAAPTFFELLTAAAFVAFREAGVDLAVLEVGLGGRLDATNVVAPAACGITAIGLEHTALLGETLEAICAEKCGIVKTSAPVATTETSAACAPVIASACARSGAPLRVLARDFGVDEVETTAAGTRFRMRSWRGLDETFQVPLVGIHQAENAAAAVALWHFLEEAGVAPAGTARAAGAVREGLASVRWRGRVECFAEMQPPLVVDSCHERRSAAALRDAVARAFPGRRVVLIFGAADDKDHDGMARELAPAAAAIIATAARSKRALEPLRLAEVFRAHAPSETIVEVATSAGEALERGRAAALTHDAVLVVGGSTYLAGEVLAILARGREPRASGSAAAGEPHD